MNDDDLRELLAHADPMPPDRDVAHHSSPEARQLLEEIMSIETNAPTEPPAHAGPQRPQWLAPVAAAAVVLLVGIGIWQATDDRDGGTEAVEAPAPLELSVTPFDPLTSSCAVFDPAQLESVDLAFAGTVTGISDGVVTVSVEETFRGDVPATVTLDAGESPALDGVAFDQDGTYLIAASDGVVGGCGSSGPDDPTLRSAYEQVFS